MHPTIREDILEVVVSKGLRQGKKGKASQERTIFMTQKGKECDPLERIIGCCVCIQNLCGRQLL